ncbi:hypothetical protein LOD99_5441 [Oopsacas minuta]|uniref:Tc1-like transposase DDE domain-containing protein n=1 Tax=Oopsacas minuta TaxID=111878 RepID=A0AAV7JRI5_9METZ|nr:hypothetical protein LOD99_5441 [Oopsacas minuta]
MWTKSGKNGSKKQRSIRQNYTFRRHYSSFETFPICIFRQNLDAKLLVNILKWHLIDQAEIFHRNRWFLVQVNDPKHISKLVKGWMSENMPKIVLEWPSQSPDLNPIENVFAILKGHDSKHHPKNLAELETSILGVWDSLSPEFLRSYWKSMKRRCQMVIDNNGNKINY